MAEPQATTRRRTPRWLRYLVDLLILLLAVFVVVSGALYWYLRRTQPRLDGTLQLAGLHGNVSIVRDGIGVPHIHAGDRRDLYVAEGYAMAQDRLWQMDLMRRLAEGRLAEIFGQPAVATDESTRILGLKRAAQRDASHLQPDEREVLEAFSTGVNLYILEKGTSLPIEFRLLHYRPELWKPVDTLAIAAQMDRTLTTSYKTEMEYAKFLRRLGPQTADELFPNHSPWDVVPGQRVSAAAPQAPVEARQGSEAVRVARSGANGGFSVAPFSRPSPGSNNWVLSGAHSMTGRPILANDPHLDYQIPVLWWTADLSAPGMHVAGVALTGAPAIVVGHNEHMAWGVTNTGADVQDLVRVQIHGQNVLTPGGWQPLRQVRETIKIRNQAAETITVQVTPMGPVVAKDEEGPLALRWLIDEPGALQVAHVFVAIDRAANWTQFEQALAGYPGPAQNFVYADVDGHIGFQCAGWIPARKPGSRFLPVPAGQPAAVGNGNIPFSQLPHVFDPPGGLLITANGRITPDDYPYVISYEWDAPNRTRRIHQLLSSRPRWNPEDMRAIQMDITSEQDYDFARALRDAASHEAAQGRVPPPELRHALDLLNQFSGRMRRNDVAPTLVVKTREELLRRVLTARMGGDLADQYVWREAPVVEQAILAERPRDWLPPEWRSRGWDALLVDCLRAVVRQEQKHDGPQRWGTHEVLDVHHPVFTHIPLLRSFADLGPVEMSGSPLTVKQTTPRLGPSMRFVADLSDWDQSTLTLLSGESGQIFNVHYRDQFRPWLRGEGLPLWFSQAAVRVHAKHDLELTPLRKVP